MVPDSIAKCFPEQLLYNWLGFAPDNNNLFEEFKFNGLWIPHCSLWTDIFNLLIHLINSLIWNISPEWEEQASAICLEFKLNLLIAPE